MFRIDCWKRESLFLFFDLFGFAEGTAGGLSAVGYLSFESEQAFGTMLLSPLEPCGHLGLLVDAGLLHFRELQVGSGRVQHVFLEEV